MIKIIDRTHYLFNIICKNQWDQVLGLLYTQSLNRSVDCGYHAPLNEMVSIYSPKTKHAFYSFHITFTLEY